MHGEIANDNRFTIVMLDYSVISAVLANVNSDTLITRQILYHAAQPESRVCPSEYAKTSGGRQ